MRAAMAWRLSPLRVGVPAFRTGQLKWGLASRLVTSSRAPLDAKPSPPRATLPDCLSEPLTAALKQRDIHELTEIQRTAIPRLMSDRRTDFLLASHTGSGKTLAYLLPLGEWRGSQKGRGVVKEVVRRGSGACWRRSAPLAITVRMCLPRSPVEILKETERAGVASRPKRPRVLVLAPTRELAEQITGVAKHLSHFAKYRASCLTGGVCGCFRYVESCV